MNELLRITMDAKQVCEACREWALKRSALDPGTYNANVTVHDAGASVSFVKKRERKAKAQA